MKIAKMVKLKILSIVILLAGSQINMYVLASTAIRENYKLAYINLNWWKKFNDPILKKYMIKAYENNNDLKIASAKIRQGQQAIMQSLGQELPQLNISGNFNRTMRSSNIYYGEVLIPEFSQSQFVLPLTMNYEIDIWGKNKMKTKSKQKQLTILKQSERATYIALTSALAVDYYSLIKVNKMLDYQKQIMDLQKNILNLTKAKYNGGLTNINEVIAEKKTLTLIENEKNMLEEDKDVLENQISVLIDTPIDGKLETASYDKISLIDIPDKLNSDVIENRPDFVISQEQLKKIGIDVKVAKKELLPFFIFSGQAGFNAYEWGKLLNGDSFLSSVGIIPIWNVFTGGQKIAYLRMKKYEYEEANEKYKKTILTSFQEVNDSLYNAKTAKKIYKGSVERLSLENENYSLLSQKHEIGAISNLQKLKVQEAFLITEKNEVSNKINYLISAIGLYKAVGGTDFLINKENI